MATVVDVTGASYPRECKGQRIQPMEGVSLRAGASPAAPLDQTQPLFWEHEGNRAVRSGNWKLVSRYPDDMGALRHRRRSRRAQQSGGTAPDVVATLAAEWDAWAKRANVDSWTGPRRATWGDDIPK